MKPKHIESVCPICGAECQLLTNDKHDVSWCAAGHVTVIDDGLLKLVHEFLPIWRVESAVETK
jgi:hypothetical protein